MSSQIDPTFTYLLYFKRGYFFSRLHQAFKIKVYIFEKNLVKKKKKECSILLLKMCNQLSRYSMWQIKMKRISKRKWKGKEGITYLNNSVLQSCIDMQFTFFNIKYELWLDFFGQIRLCQILRSLEIFWQLMIQTAVDFQKLIKI